MRRYLAAALLAAVSTSCEALRPAESAAPRSVVAPIVIDPGHGGIDYGGVVDGVKEKNLALDLALELKKRLAQRELEVRLTRESDERVMLDKRVVDAVDWNGAAFVSLHFNKEKNKKANGMIVYTYGPEKRKPWRKLAHPTVAPMPAPPKNQADESARLGRAFAKALRADGHRVEVGHADYYVLKNPSQPSVLLELGYLTNPEERERIKDPAYRAKIADTLARVIVAYAEERALHGVQASNAVPPAAD
ncbi:MAG: N-acetylmuramoyl-L-alanine amidase [Elusimicrobiota bacterium]|nr:N-acetylmuramoyl-L-alanine amidase [Elusimicrobiota bacterium]